MNHLHNRGDGMAGVVGAGAVAGVGAADGVGVVDFVLIMVVGDGAVGFIDPTMVAGELA